jgi:HKD family nuclease
MSLFTNTSSRSDFFIKAFNEYSVRPCEVYIAVAFLTQSQPIIDIRGKGCRIKLIVRLGYPTKPEALKDLLGREGIQIRFVNDRSFHPKLYIFRGACAIVGSSNMTDAALMTNQEVNIAIDPEDDRYSDLVSLFVDWWDQSKVFNEESLKDYTDIYNKNRARHDTADIIDDYLEKKQGRIRIKNIERGTGKPSSSEIYLDQYRKDYQVFHDSFKTVERIYKSVGKRKYTEDVLPLRIEIDAFFSFVREKKAPKDSYLSEPILLDTALEEKIRSTIEEWHEIEWPWLDNEIVPKRYPTIQRVLGSPDSIEKATMDEIIDALSSCHSFFDRLRFYHGGHDAHVKEFKETNKLEHIKKTITYLLYGEEDFIRRMGRCIYDPAFTLNSFGQSNVQELLGWVNGDNIPICNNRTLRSVRWLGFDVTLVGG